MKRNFVILITALILPGLLNFTSVSFAQNIPKGGKWVKKAEIPTARAYLAAAAVNGMIYVFGGSLVGAQNEGWVSTVDVYNPANDTWAKKADMPTKRGRIAASVLDGKIYVMGGSTIVDRRGQPIGKTLKTLEVYDPATDTWEKKADMLTANTSLSTAALNGKIYIVAGWTNVGGTTALSEIYDPATDTWVKSTPLISKRIGPTAAAVNGKVYGFGGFRKEAHWVEIVEEFDPATNQWTRKADLPTPRQHTHPNAPVVDGKIYVMGGDKENQIVPTVEVYDPEADTWAEVRKMPTARNALAAAAVKGKIYAIGGRDQEPLATLEEYTPEGWPFAVEPQGKLATTWGQIKATD